MKEYAVMRTGDLTPHRLPFREEADDRFGGQPMSSDAQLAWCLEWVSECLAMGMRPDVFSVASREVTDWRPL